MNEVWRRLPPPQACSIFLKALRNVMIKSVDSMALAGWQVKHCGLCYEQLICCVIILINSFMCYAVMRFLIRI